MCGVIRPATEDDLEAINDIYNHYVAETHVTFDDEPMDMETRREWFTHYAPEGRHRLFVAVGEGTVIEGATIRHSILGQGVVIERDAVVEDSIVMDNTTVGRGARIRRAIIDRFNAIDAGAVIGEGAEQQPERCVVDPSGITVMARGATRVRGAAPGERVTS